jgi:hypothetical protein
MWILESFEEVANLDQLTDSLTRAWAAFRQLVTGRLDFPLTPAGTSEQDGWSLGLDPTSVALAKAWPRVEALAVTATQELREACGVLVGQMRRAAGTPTGDRAAAGLLRAGQVKDCQIKLEVSEVAGRARPEAFVRVGGGGRWQRARTTPPMVIDTIGKALDAKARGDVHIRLPKDRPRRLFGWFALQFEVPVITRQDLIESAGGGKYRLYCKVCDPTQTWEAVGAASPPPVPSDGPGPEPAKATPSRQSSTRCRCGESLSEEPLQCGLCPAPVVDVCPQCHLELVHGGFSKLQDLHL